MKICRICGEELKFVVGMGYVHQDGHLYKGECLCPDNKHAYSNDASGRIICPTWRDDHCAQPIDAK